MPPVEPFEIPVVSVVIANFNGGALFAECIDSLRRNPQQVPFEVIVVDDCSSDDSSSHAEAALAGLRLLRNERNLGLTRSINRGLKHARGRFMLVLDNDTTVQAGAIDALASHLEVNPEVGIAAARLFNPDGSLQRTARRFPHPLNGLFGRRSLITRWLPNNRYVKAYMMTEYESSETPYTVDWGSTAALMVRREALLDAGALDEDFFVYWCDADWCHRMKRHGWRVDCVPAARVIHNENLKANHQKGRRTRMIRDFHRGAWTYFRKNQLDRPYGPMGLFTWTALAVRSHILIGADAAAWHWRRLVSASANSNRRPHPGPGTTGD